MRDVDLVRGCASTTPSSCKDRLVPPARPPVVRLQKYAAALGPRSDDDYFFPSALLTAGRRNRATTGNCCTDAASATARGEGPRLTTCATPSPCTSCCAGTARGADLQARMPVLATYLGRHARIDGTQDYLQMTAESSGDRLAIGRGLPATSFHAGPGGRQRSRPTFPARDELPHALPGRPAQPEPDDRAAYRDVFTLLCALPRRSWYLVERRLWPTST